MPWDRGICPLPDNLSMARKGLDNLKRMLRSGVHNLEDAIVLKDCLKGGIIKEIPTSNSRIKKSSVSTTRRSAQEKGQPSLNQCLGINLIEIIPWILIKF